MFDSVFFLGWILIGFWPTKVGLFSIFLNCHVGFTELVSFECFCWNGLWYFFLVDMGFAGLPLIMPQAEQPLWLRCLIEFLVLSYKQFKRLFSNFFKWENLQVDSANRRGSLLEVVQVLTDLNLIIRRAYISSDGEWFMDGELLFLYIYFVWDHFYYMVSWFFLLSFILAVFHVTDQHGDKLCEDYVTERIQQVSYLFMWNI